MLTVNLIILLVVVVIIIISRLLICLERAWLHLRVMHHIDFIDIDASCHQQLLCFYLLKLLKVDLLPRIVVVLVYEENGFFVQVNFLFSSNDLGPQGVLLFNFVEALYDALHVESLASPLVPVELSVDIVHGVLPDLFARLTNPLGRAHAPAAHALEG